jgi:hypothetical protein
MKCNSGWHTHFPWQKLYECPQICTKHPPPPRTQIGAFTTAPSHIQHQSCIVCFTDKMAWDRVCGTGAANWPPLSNPPDDTSVSMEQRWNGTDRGKRKYWEGNLSQCHRVHRKWNTGSEPGSPGRETDWATVQPFEVAESELPTASLNRHMQENVLNYNRRDSPFVLRASQAPPVGVRYSLLAHCHLGDAQRVERDPYAYGTVKNLDSVKWWTVLTALNLPINILFDSIA